MKEGIYFDFVYNSTYTEVYLLVFFYFIVLYFGLAPVFNFTCRWLEKKNLLNRITQKAVSKKQILFELRHSFFSIIIFGFSGIPIIYLIRSGVIQLRPDTILNILFGVVLLNIWNEIHFFIVHRIMHLPFFMKKVHYIHHRSTVPTVYSVYSFHWLEAFLLSTVPLAIAPFIALAPSVFIIYPLSSILLNYSGHCNYRFGSGQSTGIRMLATNHNAHHSKFRKNYGFASDIPDRIYDAIRKWITPEKQ